MKRLLSFLAAAALAVPAAAQEPASSVHGFMETSFKNSYVTPRGLVVSSKGLTTQPVLGLVFGLYEGQGFVDSLSLVTGVWGDLNSEQRHPQARTLNELDWFGGVSARVARRWDLSATYLLFMSPPQNFVPERNLEFKAGFDDTDFLHAWALHPYAKLFWALGGDSTVVLGKRGRTYDVELGVVPGRGLDLAGDYRVGLTLPTFLTLGGPAYFGDGGTLGVFSTGPSASFPLPFIPGRLGRWHADAGLSYFHLINDNLVRASRILGNAGRRDEWVTSLRLGMDF